MLTGEVEEILICHPEPVEVLEVDIAQPLEVEGAPGDEEEDDNTHCKVLRQNDITIHLHASNDG